MMLSLTQNQITVKCLNLVIRTLLISCFDHPNTIVLFTVTQNFNTTLLTQKLLAVKCLNLTTRNLLISCLDHSNLIVLFTVTKNFNTMLLTM